MIKYDNKVMIVIFLACTHLTWQQKKSAMRLDDDDYHYDHDDHDDHDEDHTDNDDYDQYDDHEDDDHMYDNDDHHYDDIRLEVTWPTSWTRPRVISSSPSSM